MQLQHPFIISARLLPAVVIGDTTLSISFDGESEGRARYRYYIDNPQWEHSNNDLKSGVGGGSLQEGMESLLSFLSACAESRRYRLNRAGGENAELFLDNVGEWAESVSDELSSLAIELEEGGELISD